MTKPRKIYIAGPMTGIEDYNRPAFDGYEIELVAQGLGHIVLNPAVHPVGLEHHEYMQLCRPMVEVADEIHLLPGWERSKGAMMEYGWALAGGKSIHYVGESQ